MDDECNKKRATTMFFASKKKKCLINDLPISSDGFWGCVHGVGNFCNALLTSCMFGTRNIQKTEEKEIKIVTEY